TSPKKTLRKQGEILPGEGREMTQHRWLSPLWLTTIFIPRGIWVQPFPMARKKPILPCCLATAINVNLGPQGLKVGAIILATPAPPRVGLGSIGYQAMKIGVRALASRLKHTQREFVFTQLATRPDCPCSSWSGAFLTKITRTPTPSPEPYRPISRRLSPATRSI